MNQTKKQIIYDALRHSLLSAPLLYLGFFLDAGINSYSANITGQFFNSVMENRYGEAQELLGMMLLTLLVCTMVLPLVVLGTNILFFHFSIKYDYSVTSSFYKKSYKSMLGFSPGAIVQRLFRDPGKLLMLLVSIPAKSLAQVTALLLMSFFMVRISPLMCMVCIGLGILAAVFPFFLKGKLAKLDEARKKFDDRTAVAEMEMIQNRSFFKSYGIEDFTAARQRKLYTSHYKDQLKPGVWSNILATSLPECFLLLGNVAFLLIGKQQAETGLLRAGDLIAFFAYLNLTTSLVKQLYNQWRQMVGLSDSVNRIATLVNDAEEDGGTSIGNWKKIQVANVTFRYKEDTPEIKYSDFTIDRNSLVEIKGANGAGKTTLIWMLCGLLKPKSGSIMVDNQSMEKLDISEWREEISCIEQIPAIFIGTLRENIHIGRLDASPEQVDKVLKLLHLDEQTDRELTSAQQLSGGELKKISLGRAILRDSSIVVFDEPFEHLDVDGQAIVNKMLSDKTKTRIVIQHGDHRKFAAECVVEL